MTIGPTRAYLDSSAAGLTVRGCRLSTQGVRPSECRVRPPRRDVEGPAAGQMRDERRSPARMVLKPGF